MALEHPQLQCQYNILLTAPEKAVPGSAFRTGRFYHNLLDLLNGPSSNGNLPLPVKVLRSCA